MCDLGARRWEDMPPGMLAGWKGSAAAASTGGAETIFVVDDERGALIAYDSGGDRWRTVAESERLKGAAEMAAGGSPSRRGGGAPRGACGGACSYRGNNVFFT